MITLDKSLGSALYMYTVQECHIGKDGRFKTVERIAKELRVDADEVRKLLRAKSPKWLADAEARRRADPNDY